MFASFLHPRTKNLTFVDDDKRQNIHDQIKVEMRKLNSEATDTSDEPPQKRQNSNHDVMEWLDDILEPQNTCSVVVQSDKVEFEMIQYLNEPCCKTDVLDWWRQKEQFFPLLSQLARKYLCVPASSVPAERIFSTAGYLINNKRACLRAEHVDMLIFLNKNMKQL